MIYVLPGLEEPVDQGDLIDNCPLTEVMAFLPDVIEVDIDYELHRVVVLTLTCDLANDITTLATVVEVQTAQFFVDEGILKPADIKGPLRSGRIWGLYCLPTDIALALPEMIVDFRRLHTVKLDLLRSLCQAGKRPGRIQPLCREHLAKHFADTFSRIGLPRPYETM